MGGYFIKDIKLKNQISGRLIDLYGSSKLEGILGKDKLEFRKQYEQCNNEQLFEYNFILKNGIWLGEYSSRDGYSGRSICKTNSCLEGIKFENVDLSTPEGIAEALIDSMIEKGSLKKFKNFKTGKK